MVISARKKKTKKKVSKKKTVKKRPVKIVAKPENLDNEDRQAVTTSSSSYGLVFFTVTNSRYILGTLATINSIKIFYPAAEIYVFADGPEPVSTIQKRVISNIDKVTFVRNEDLKNVDVRDAWQTKAHAASYLMKKYLGKKDMIIHLDSDLVMAGFCDELMDRAIKEDKMLGGKDGSGPQYHLKEYKPYFKYCNSKKEKEDHHNPLYMSSSFFFTPINKKYAEIFKMWSYAMDRWAGGPQKGEKLYGGHGDQGVLNAIIFYKGIEPICIDNSSISEHWCHGKELVEYNNYTFFKGDERCYGFHSVSGPQSETISKYWDNGYVKYMESKDGNLDVVYTYWLWLLFHGPTGLYSLGLSNKEITEVIQRSPHLKRDYDLRKDDFKHMFPLKNRTINPNGREIKRMDGVYDIEFVLPVAGSAQKWLDRLEDFKKYGLHNINTARTLITILPGDHEIEDLDKGWPCNFRIVRTKENNAAQKIYEFYSKYKASDINHIRWSCKLDDDSMTNVDKLVNDLDIYYDHERDYYLVSDLNFDSKVYKDVLEEFGFKNWFIGGTLNERVRDDYSDAKGDRKFELAHEHEACIISQCTMQKMYENKTVRKMLKRMSEKPGGYGDHGVAYAARIIKVHPLDCQFMTAHPAVKEFSVFGGRFHHIHYIHREEKRVWGEFEKIINIKSGSIKKTTFSPASTDDQRYMKLFSGKSFEFGRVPSDVITNRLILQPGGKIKGGNPNNEHEWNIRNKKLRFMNISGTATTEFDIDMSNPFYFEGKFLLYGDTIHYIKLI